MKHTETPQAEWVYSKDKIQFVCSNCGEIPTKYTGCSLALYYLNKYYHFCRNCGAKMKGGAEE